MTWLMFQMSALGPSVGQNVHFRAREGSEYASERFGNEVGRLLGVIEQRLSAERYLAGDAYSIADMATYPWLRPTIVGSLEHYPAISRWFEELGARPAVQRALAVRLS
ncbi:MAG: glutathione S-transferase family protein [Bradymonadaceae bacterium]|nr:glutathione S-transferase family protein [Lujinxingiaceae bacterium]